MSETERTAMLLERVRAALAKDREISPKERFQRMVDAGLINQDGQLRREDSPSRNPAAPMRSKA
jgi:hypothetical protein